MCSTSLMLAVLWLLLPVLPAFRIEGALFNGDPYAEELPVREEINSFAGAGPAFDLYILALQQMQGLDQTEMLSYFQIAGIHGYPAQPWDGVAGSGPYPGFCMHAAVVFPTWHRAYLALFEMVWHHAQDIAAQYPEDQRERYEQAAYTLRLPFWDWAAEPGLPPATTTPTLHVNTPGGYHEIPNPLYEYAFHPGPEGNGLPGGLLLTTLPATTRHYDPVTKQRNDSAATAALLNNAANTQAMTYQLLSSVSDYSTMSCTSPGGHPNPSVSLEAIHNNIHNLVGGYGTMTWPELAAFDPIFWLHHVNVDRVFALWQALNLGSYVVPVVNAFGSFAEPRGTIDSANSTLAPFHIDDGTTLFTSGDLRDVRRLAYTYPELTPYNISSGERKAHVRDQVNRLYAATATLSSLSQHDAAQKAGSIEQAFSGATFQKVRKLGPNNQAVQWSIRIEVNRASFNMSYNIDFFVGRQPSSVTDRSVATNLVGTYGQFVSHHGHDMGLDSTRTMSGEVALTPILVVGVSRGFLSDLSATSVLPILKKHLNWAARTADNDNIDLGHLPGLLISVRSRQVQPRRANAEFPVYGAFRTHPEATKNKVGGL